MRQGATMRQGAKTCSRRIYGPYRRKRATYWVDTYPLLFMIRRNVNYVNEKRNPNGSFLYRALLLVPAPKSDPHFALPCEW